MMIKKISWSFLMYSCFACSLSLFSADQVPTTAKRAETTNDQLSSLTFCQMGSQQNAMMRVVHDLTHKGYATFENYASCPLSKGVLETLTSIFDRVAIPYQEIEEDVHNNANEFVIILYFSENARSTSISAPDKFIIKNISVSNNNITTDDMAKIISIVRQILNLLGDKDLGSVFTVNLTYYDEFRKKAEAFEARAASITKPIIETLKIDELPWHQDKFGPHYIDFLGLFVLDAVGIGQNFLQLGLLDQNALVEHQHSASNARDDSPPKIVANIFGQQGSGYLVDQSRVLDSSIIVHRRTALLTYFSNSPLSENMIKSDPNFFETTANEYPTWHNNCSSKDYVRPSRKVLIVRIKKDSEI